MWAMIYEIKRFLGWAGKMWEERYDNMYERNGIYYLIAGMCDRAVLIEHGTSIRFPWLTEKGKCLLEALTKFSQHEIASSYGKAYDGCEYGDKND